MNLNFITELSSSYASMYIYVIMYCGFEFLVVSFLASIGVTIVKLNSRCSHDALIGYSVMHAARHSIAAGPSLASVISEYFKYTRRLS